MATIEELTAKVAGLEQQMAAITTPPTEYYTSAYGGEEIDAAVKKASEGLAGGVTSFNGRTGAVKPQAGDYNATQIPVSGEPKAETVAAALSNKAPSGFGLGERSKELTSDDDLNTIRENGWYRWGSSSPQNAPKMTSDAGGSGYIFARVTNYDAQNVLQEYWSLNQEAQNQARRICRNGTWGPLEWINPPMQLGVEYRTTERYDSKPVYAKAVNFGALPANSSKSVAHGISDMARCFEVVGSYGVQNLVGEAAVTTIGANTENISIATDKNLSAETAIVLMKYTKTTD